MVIAPGEEIDHQWVKSTGYALRFLRPMAWTALDIVSPLQEMPDVEQATLRRHRNPAWRIDLAFYVHDRLGPAPSLPLGYVMPGWIVGAPLESREIGTWAHDKWLHRWELRGQFGDLMQAVTCETLAHTGGERLSHFLAREEVRPLPPEAEHGCPPRPDVPMPVRSVAEVLRILDGDEA